MSSHLRALTAAYRHAVDHLDGLESRPVAATASVGQLRERLGVPLPTTETPADVVIDEMVAAASGGHLGSASGRFFAWVIGGALPSALAADWLASTWDNNAALCACGPAAAVVEEVAGGWLKDILELPKEASFAFTTGCQLAHMTCLAAARHALLARAGWDVEADGLFGAPRIRVICSAQRHGSIERAVRFLGLGSNSLEPIVTEHDGRISPARLEAALVCGKGPTIVVLNAADLNVGAFDPFVELIPIAKDAGAWVHVDGAFGLWARASPERRHLAEGVELADSWATDAHKWLNTPQDSGLAFVRDARAHKAAMTLSASYLASSDEARDEIDWTPDWTRRARGFAVYAALRELGRAGVANLIERCCLHATTLAHGISVLPNAQMLVPPTLNQGLVRFLDPNSSSEADHDHRTDATIQAINDTGEAFFSGTTWNGRRAMRISVCNWRTSAQDIERTIEAFDSVLKSQKADRS